MPLPTPPKVRGSRLSDKELNGHQKATTIQSAYACADDDIEIPSGGGAQHHRAPNSARVVPLKTVAPVAPAQAKTTPRPIDIDAAETTSKPKRGLTTKRTTKANPAARTKNAKSKLFVLDTNVLLHDPSCLFRFSDNDVFIPMIVLEELDGHKKGLTDLARNARQVSRWLDQLAAQPDSDVVHGLALDTCGHGEGKTMGKLFFQTEPIESSLPASLPIGKADNQILAVFSALRAKYADRDVVLVSKDINIRVKARALGLEAEDYSSDQTLDDAALLYPGWTELPHDFWDQAGPRVESWQQNGQVSYRIHGPVMEKWRVNEFLTLKQHGEPDFHARVMSVTGSSAVITTVRDFGNAKNAIIGVNARNRGQNYALNLLMDPEVDFVTLTGNAGTGKTLMVLAAALHQVLNDQRYTEIVVTRATVPVGDDIGFLPGTEEEKMAPWMGAVDDNLEVLAQNRGGEWARASNSEVIRSKIKIKSMNFMRGRTFLNKIVIIDEAQNLTPKQMKTLITRAGPGTKIICMGNLAQIDTPYLTEGSSGLTYAVERFKGWAHSGHITLEKGERSRLADFASEAL